MRRQKLAVQPFLRLWSLCLACVLIFTSTASADQKLSDILELRGITRINGVFEFSIYNKERKRSEWLRPQEPLEGYEILYYDFEKRFIRIRFENRVGNLDLQASQVTHYTETASSPVPSVSLTSNSPSQPPSKMSPTPPPPRQRTEQHQNTATATEADNQTDSPSFPTGGGFHGSRRNPGDPGDPNDPGDPSNPGTPDSGDDDNGDDAPPPGIGSPPPMPPTSPPQYSPKA